MKLSACIEVLFNEAGDDFADRVRAAAAAGLPAVEFWNWRDKDLAGIAAAAQDRTIQIAGFCVEPWGQLTDPASHNVFLAGLRETCAQAQWLGVNQLITQVGQTVAGVERAVQRDAVVAALKAAGPIVEDAGVTLLIEPLNDKVDHPGYFLTDTAEAVTILRRTGSPAVALIYDRYHAMAMGEPIGHGLEGNTDLIRHVHIADAPGRHEPGSGRADWPAELAWFKANHYDGFFGLEYWPTVETAKSLEHFASLTALA
ncbi:MAG: TIM barrel protein [Bifidobacteriaceae bacterium]|nr:TIM barrel protein [Bifidobacteriaceae bacterium]